MSTVIISDMYQFLVCAVLSLGSTDDAFLTTICLRKPHLEHHSPSFFQRHVLLFQFPATFAEWFFQGLSVSTLIISDKYLFLVLYGRRFLTSICLRKPHLEHHSPSIFQRHVLLFHLSATFAEWFFRGCL